MTFTLPDQFVELPPGPVDDLALKETVEAIQRNLAALALQIGGLDAAGGALRVLGNGGRRMALGVATCVFTAAAGTPLVSVTHGLGVTPVVVEATCGVAAGGQNECWAVAANLGTTTFQLTANGTTVRTTTVPVYWLAIA